MRCIYLLFTIRTQECVEKARVSTAYGFFKTLKESSVFVPKDYSKRAKPIYSASKYETYYVAADENDELGKEDIWLTLNREEKRDCTPLHGSSFCYDFLAEPSENRNEHIVLMRHLPCPCAECRNRNYGACTNKDIVGEMTAQELSYLAAVDTPDLLNTPLTQYTCAVLRAFIVSQQGPVPRVVTTKPQLIAHITNTLAAFVVDREDAA